MSTEVCDPKVYKRGTSMGVFNFSKEEAEAYCKAETERTGYKHDWHFYAGRAHVLALIPNKLSWTNRAINFIKHGISR